MLIRHITAAENVDESGRLVDPLAVKHGVIVGGRVAALGGPVDPSTHLNLDFAEHDRSRSLVSNEFKARPLLIGDPQQPQNLIDFSLIRPKPVDRELAQQAPTRAAVQPL